MDSGSDSDGAPEELTAVQGVEKHDEITKVEKDSAVRATREGKERRKRWAQRKTSSKSSKSEKQSQRKVEDEETKQSEESEETHTIPGMLPADVIEMLAAREKQTFESDSEEEDVKPKAQKRKKKLKTTGPETILLKDVRATQQIKSAMDFLERRKHQVPRSNAVLKNAHTAFRLISKRNL
ncbi:hypothetical protein PR202_ga06707 [Eleusine coracana subsp. coracana]|uniref:Uncharacterized protein n=1 Tax=Eleusine coracana subsp. coracana TaxID=191504 RepID=A0AAV5BZ37_ELECO|nr:hypothetical protein PR202_ga06707 [Eleusine coracana subsp. coracana]